MDFEKKFEKIQELIDFMKEHTAGMDKASFLSIIGTVMKVYSINHDIPMMEFVIEFAAGIFEVENSLSAFGISDEDNTDD